MTAPMMKPMNVAKPRKTHPIVIIHFMFIFLKTQARRMPAPVMTVETIMKQKNPKSTLLTMFGMVLIPMRVSVIPWSFITVWLFRFSTLTVVDERLAVNVAIWV